MHSRRRRAAVVLLFASAWWIVGCSRLIPGVTPQATTLSNNPVQQATINRTNAPIDTLRWSIEGVKDLTSLDPALAGDSQTVTVMNFIYSGLLRLNANLEVVAADAETWEASADGTIYTFTLRPDLRFGSGDPVTAADYVYSLNRALLPATGSYGAPTQLNTIVGAKDVIAGKADAASGIRAINDRTLEIRLEQPSAAFLQQLTFSYTFVLHQHLVESALWREQPYGTGPFLVKTWKHGDQLELVANPYYWQGKPSVEHLVVRFSADSATAYQRYVNGELDIMGGLQNPLPSVYLPQVSQLPDLRTSPALTTRYIGFNNVLPPFDDDDVRRAFAQAIDRTAIADTVLGGEAVPAKRILPPGMIGTQREIQPLIFDPIAAKASLAKAGYPNGEGLPPITLTYAPEGENEQVVQAIQAAWKTNLGVSVALQPLDVSAFSAALDQTWLLPDKGLQIYYSIWGADYPDPQNFLSLQLHSGSPYNNGHFSDQRFDNLVDEADRIGSRTQIQRRLLLYNQAEQIAIDRVGWLPILHSKVHLLMAPRVQGVTVTPNGLVIADWSKLSVNS